MIAVKIFATLLCCLHASSAANILAILPMPSPSHHIWNSPLMVALARRGHSVTVVSPEGLKSPVANLTDLVLTGFIEALQEEVDYEEYMDASPIVSQTSLFEFMGDQCARIYEHEAWARLMNYRQDTKFDLIIIEAIGAECLLPALSRFGNPPIVTVNAFNTLPWMFEWSGSPYAISHIPHFAYSVGDRMTFWQRLTNFVYNAHILYLYHYQYLPDMDKVAREHNGPDSATFDEIKKRISISMPSYHPVFDYPFARSPTLIPVAGIHIKEPKPLPKDLQEFLDSATEGAIFFSLGTNVKSERLKPEQKKAILDAFAELPQKVLWKFEADSLPGLPKNVRIEKWLPQSDILAHPNVKVFISHSGLLSTQEAIYRGVPVLGIPFFVDQPINIDKLSRHGAGLRLDVKDITKENLLKALRTLLHDHSYRENMKELSSSFRDDPQTPMDRAVFWTEYVIRHNGAYHLQSAARDLNFAQYFLLDVIAFLLAVPTLLILGLYYSCCRRRPKQKTKQKKN